MARLKEKIEDFGEKIGGAKKDYYSKNGISVKDLEDLSHRQLIDNTIKAHVLKKINYEELIKNGMDKTVAFFIKRSYDSFPTKFKATENFETDKETAIRYIELGKVCEEAISKIKTINDFAQVKNKLIQEGYVTSRGYRHYTLTEKANNIDIVKFFNNLNISNYDISKAKTKIEETNFPKKQESWRKGLVIKEINKEFVICKKNNGYYYRIQDGFKTETEAEKYLIEELKPKIENERKKKNNTVEIRPQLKNIVRKGQDYRDSKDINTDDFLNVFKFRGGEFGNWNTQSDRQQNLNLAYDSLLDLANVLKISPQAISLDGTLSLAFGSRGSGGKNSAVAHYEPGAVVINLTKMNGAGSLAHEWGHALDDYYGRLSGNSKLNNFMSDGVKETTSKTPETAKKFKEVINAIKTKELNQEEIEMKYKNKLAEYKDKMEKDFLGVLCNRYGIDIKDHKRILSEDINIMEESFVNFKNEFKKATDKEILEVYIKRYEAFKFGIEECKNNIDNSKKLVGKEFGDTDFFSGAKFLDSGRSKDYWSTNKELFARAFESYVENVMRKNNIKSDYLVYGTGSYPLYVSGREKDLIFPKIEDLIDSMKELDRNSIIKDNFTKVENSYENKDFKESKVKEKESGIGDKVKSNAFISVDDGIVVYRYENKDNSIDIVKFDSYDFNLKGIELNITEESLKNYKFEGDFKSNEIENKANEIIAKIKTKDKFDFEGIFSTVDNEKAFITISEENLYNVTLLDKDNKIIDTINGCSKDEISSMFLKSQIIEFEKPNVDFNMQISKDLIKFNAIKNELDKYRVDGMFDCKINDKSYEVYMEDGGNLKLLHYDVKDHNVKENFMKEYEFVNKLSISENFKIVENYELQVARAIEKENIRANGILEELKKYDSLSFKNEYKHIIVIPSFAEEDSKKIIYIYQGEPQSHVTLKSLESVAQRLSDEGLSKDNIVERLNVEDLKIKNVRSINDVSIPSGNIAYKDLKNKGDIYVIKLKNEDITKLNNLKQDYCTFKNGNYINVAILKIEKEMAFNALGLSNMEISKIPYSEFKKQTGSNRYILMTNDEFEKLKQSSINYSAFKKESMINVVLKEKDLNEALNVIGRKYEKTLGNISYNKLKESSDLEYRQFNRKEALNIMDKLMDCDVKFSAFYKGDNAVNIAINKNDISKLKDIIEKINIKKGIEK